MKLQGRVIVTGASEGIGREFCLRLAAEGAQVLAVARNQGRLESLLSALPGSGHALLVADLSNSSDRELLLGQIRMGSWQGLINNAGFGHLGSFQEVDLEIWQRMLRLNVDNVVELSHAFLRQAESGAFLINVSSTLSFLPMPIQSVYSATKAFVTSFSESLWFQYRDQGVRVLNLCPGITRTQFNQRAGGRPEDLPDFLSQNAEEVVDEAWFALFEGDEPTHVCGWKNRLGVLASRILSRRSLISFMGKARQ